MFTGGTPVTDRIRVAALETPPVRSVHIVSFCLLQPPQGVCNKVCSVGGTEHPKVGEREVHSN